ncbi:hypothetical protein D0Z67_29385 (plasmid) [Streptomyces seoulensis]|uniref:Uncharacterized protein n=1 Tax=Streptomyces seoulensis TaxID=73044 RepID=A0A4P6U4Z3_STRSO|nr:hypothetical protein [Streptomyces seoulensis]QBJ94483.1 hypothetical protein D0Z67_29385 [Streptomyces seoulensis]
MADHDPAYVDTLATELCRRHTALLATAENDLAVLRSRIALTVAFIHDPTQDRDARTNLARRLQLPEPGPQ